MAWQQPRAKKHVQHERAEEDRVFVCETLVEEKVCLDPRFLDRRSFVSLRFCDAHLFALSLLYEREYTSRKMNSITGWATKMMIKQKMGNVADSVPGLGTQQPAKDPKAPTGRQMRKDIKAIREERDAEYEAKKAERGAKKTSMADRWAQNKAAGN
jgi:hypothetical protein